MYEPRERLIVALDVPTAAAATKIVAAVGNSASVYKVGMQLFTAEGPQAVSTLIADGHGVFLDLKYHDIPNTVAAAVRAAAGLGVSMLTIHASGGTKMLRAAVEAGAQVEPSMKILAVTVLTSMDDTDLTRVGVRGRTLDQVLRLAALATDAGCHGLVASAHEASELRRELGDNFLIVTPGVRPTGADVGDQTRVATPSEAIAAGATHIVVGRPITGAEDPAAAARDILGEIS
jgi:orotidine-5'-phosphate decarboxylase